jgi:5-methylcytosine-specific restriction protein A
VSFRHSLRVFHSNLRESAKRGTFVGHLVGPFLGVKERNPLWAHLEREFKADHPTCAACGMKDKLQVHHMKPFHLKPELELDPDNLITLCMGTFECHLRIGHGGNFRAYNPNVEMDSEIALAHPEQRDEIEVKAEAARQFTLEG